MNNMKSIIVISAAISALSLPNSASAEISADKSADTSTSTKLEEIVVTARKKAENLQTVPISISAVTGSSLQSAGIVRLEALAATIPNFFFSETVSFNDQISIRGLGSGVNPGFENSVGQVIDGFFFGKSRFGRAAFLDVQQVEILKGPQGPLIGKNTTAGAINIRTARPTDTLSGYVIASDEVEGDLGQTIEEAISGPLTDRLKVRLAARYDNHDGYYHNNTTTQSEMRRRNLTFRGIVDYDITGKINASLMYQHGNENRNGRNREYSHCGAADLAVLLTVGENCRFDLHNTSNNIQNGKMVPDTTNTRFDLAGLTINVDAGGLGEITSLTGYSGYKANDNWDGDLTPIEAQSFTSKEKYYQISQELRLASKGKNTVDYLVGAYFLYTHQEEHFSINFDFQGPAPLFAVFPLANRATDNRFTTQKGNTEAVFGQATWHMTDQVGLTAGLRLTREHKEADNSEFPTALYTDTLIAPPPGGPASATHIFNGSLTETQLTPNLSLQWQPNNQTMLYAKVDRGFKSGGFDQSIGGGPGVANRFQYRPETVTSEELGSKLTLLDDSMQLNVALFHMEFKNLQVSSLVPGASSVVFQVGNAASAISQGVEADIRWRPISRLNIIASGAYLDAHYKDYSAAPCYQNQTMGCVGGLQSLSGAVLMSAPKWKFAISGEYTRPLSSEWNLISFLQVDYSGKYSLTQALDPYGWQDAYAKLDARLTLENVAKGLEFSVIGRNLTDKLTSNFGNTNLNSSFFRFAEPPREILLQARYNF